MSENKISLEAGKLYKYRKNFFVIAYLSEEDIWGLLSPSGTPIYFFRTQKESQANDVQVHLRLGYGIETFLLRKHEPFLVLGIKNGSAEILVGEKKGWIWCKDPENKFWRIG